MNWFEFIFETILVFAMLFLLIGGADMKYILYLGILYLGSIIRSKE